MGCVQSDVRSSHTRVATTNTNVTMASRTDNAATNLQPVIVPELQQQEFQGKELPSIVGGANSNVDCNIKERENAPAAAAASVSNAPQPSSLIQRPEVPLTSWYAAPFTQNINTPITEFHFKNKGHVLFATRHVPVAASELEKLPHHSPSTCNSFTLGKDLIYGMAYLHNTPLFIEHYWRSRVTHLNRFKQGKVMLPRSLRRRQTSTAAHMRNHITKASKGDSDLESEREHKKFELNSDKAKDEQRQSTHKKANGAINSSHCATGTSLESSSSSSSSPLSSSMQIVKTKGKPIEQRNSIKLHSENNVSNKKELQSVDGKKSNMQESEGEAVTVMERSEASLLQQPFVDMLIGFKVYINNELVPDHYPGLRSLPQCTATLDINDATNYWVCVPFVLIGYLNHFMLDPIAIYRTLSLNFVEFLLRLKTPQDENETVDCSLRVEIVYGCRAEAYFCTDFIARGTCTLHLSRHSKVALKAYEEKLRLLIKSKKSSEQVIWRSDLLQPKNRVRNCVFCGSPLRYVCTVCGAEVCGKVSCARQQLVGYPRGCSAHKIPIEEENIFALS